MHSSHTRPRRRDKAGSDDEDWWLPSATEEEDFGDAEGANENGEWPTEGIVDEEVDFFGRSIFEIRWLGWHRSDGTSSTWTRSMNDNPDCIRSWKRGQTKERKLLTDGSVSVPVSAWNSVDVHNRRTDLNSVAYKERLARAITTRTRWASFGSAEEESVARVEDYLTQREGGDNGRSLRQKTIRQQRSMGAPYSERGTSVASSSSPVKQAPVKPLSIPDRSTTFRSSIAPETRPIKDLPTRVKTRKPDPEVHLSGRVALERAWNECARKVNAASISIVNTIDDEELPNVPKNFAYVENAYIRDSGLPDSSDDFFLMCDCDTCENPDECTCQIDSQVEDNEGRKIFAYDNEGLFLFGQRPHFEILECNRLCKCPPTCINRVAQRPRDVPMEIFKTPDRGWGVRSRVAVQKGKVLGVYVGTLMRREDSDKVENRDYIFDLDHNEMRHEEHHVGQRYSVSSYACGNWTRFINHSCDPNTFVYPVNFETVPQMNMPYYALVTNRDIPACSEFTIDYDPQTERPISKGKGKKKAKIPRGASVCTCGADDCRGYICGNF